MVDNLSAVAQDVQVLDAHTKNHATHEPVELASILSTSQLVDQIVPVIETSLSIETSTGNIPFDPNANQSKMESL